MGPLQLLECGIALTLCGHDLGDLFVSGRRLGLIVVRDAGMRVVVAGSATGGGLEDVEAPQLSQPLVEIEEHEVRRPSGVWFLVLGREHALTFGAALGRHDPLDRERATDGDHHDRDHRCCNRTARCRRTQRHSNSRSE